MYCIVYRYMRGNRDWQLRGPTVYPSSKAAWAQVRKMERVDLTTGKRQYGVAALTSLEVE